MQLFVVSAQHCQNRGTSQNVDERGVLAVWRKKSVLVHSFILFGKGGWALFSCFLDSMVLVLKNKRFTIKPTVSNFILQNKNFVSLFVLSFALSFHARWTKAVYSQDQVFILLCGQVSTGRAELSSITALNEWCWASGLNTLPTESGVPLLELVSRQLECVYPCNLYPALVLEKNFIVSKAAWYRKSRSHKRRKYCHWQARVCCYIWIF